MYTVFTHDSWAYEGKPGVLSACRPKDARGKKVFDWTFAVAGSDKVHAIAIHLHQDKTDELGAITFEATSEGLPKPIRCSDIEQLRIQVRDTLCEQAYLHSGIKWEPWYVITIDGEKDEFGDRQYHRQWRSCLGFVVTNAFCGKHPKTGELMTISRHQHVAPVPKALVMGELKDVFNPLSKTKASESVESKTTQSLIPATPENTAAIRNLMDRMTLLRESMGQLLKQDAIEENLTKIASQNLLPELPATRVATMTVSEVIAEIVKPELLGMSGKYLETLHNSLSDVVQVTYTGDDTFDGSDAICRAFDDVIARIERILQDSDAGEVQRVVDELNPTGLKSLVYSGDGLFEVGFSE